jgi:gamma-butyrobetaine dioxygenase
MDRRTGMAPDNILREIFETRGTAWYGGESVSQLQHALQAARMAELENAPPALVAAALLHDIGHLLGAGDEGLVERNIDARHEESGARFLARWFDPPVTEPVRLHVKAKSYLCAVEPGYLESLSRASTDSLAVQGGAFGPRQCRAFEQTPHFEEAVRLRRWDETAKDPAAETPPLDHYLEIARRLARPEA